MAVVDVVQAEAARSSLLYAHDSSPLSAFLLISFRNRLNGTDEEALINQPAPEPLCLNNSFESWTEAIKVTLSKA